VPGVVLNDLSAGLHPVLGLFPALLSRPNVAGRSMSLLNRLAFLEGIRAPGTVVQSLFKACENRTSAASKKLGPLRFETQSGATKR
jgi:hypothetical protein